MFKNQSKSIILFFFLILQVTIYAKTDYQLSPYAEISVLTCDPGNAIYATFGHTALRVKDTANDLDLVYNYGTFDFNTPNFYMKFVKGKLHYKLAVSKFKYFRFEYVATDRSIYEQVLNLTRKQKEELYRLLQINYRPENRYYLYDFLYDNCATRVRDIIELAIQGKIIYQYKEKKEEKSFRKLLAHYISGNSWLDLGINIALGLPADKKANLREYLFLPDFYMYVYDDSQILGNNTKKQLVKEKNIIFKTDISKKTKQIFSACVVFWLFFITGFLLTITGIWRKKQYKIIDVFLFGITGMLGLLLLFLWFFTDHYAMSGNLNILWAFPLNFFAAIFIYLLRKKKRFRAYFLFTGVLNLLVLVFWNVIPQDFHTCIIPIVLLLITRSFYLYFFTKKH